MIPIIFAYSIMLVPSFMGETLATSSGGFSNDVGNILTDVFGQQNLPYYLIVFVFVVLFTYFYTLVTYAQQNLAENLQKQGGFVPGIRPGKPTNDYITRVLVRITAAGAIFLGIIAVMPFFVTTLTDVQALTISGTGLLIVVGVVLDTMKQLVAQLMMRNYSGFIR
jgi:preprotein translocase subunit SecY